MMKTLNDDDARKLFETARVARLGCIVNGEPYVVPINCILDGDSIYSHSLNGLKIAALRENRRACVQVDEIESELSWRSAIAFGSFEEVKDPNERAEVLNMRTQTADEVATAVLSPDLCPNVPVGKPATPETSSAPASA